METIRLNKVKSPGNIQQDEHQDSADAKRVVNVHPDGTEVTSANPLPVDAIVNLSTSNPDQPQIENFNIVNANQEYSIVIPDKTVRFIMKARNLARLQFSYVPGDSGSKYMTIKPGAVYDSGDVYLVGKTLYFQSPKSNVDVEFLFWY